MPKQVMVDARRAEFISLALAFLLAGALAFGAVSLLNVHIGYLLVALGSAVGLGVSTFLQKKRARRRRPEVGLLSLPPASECQAVSPPSAVTRVLQFVPNAKTLEQKCINSLAWRQLGPSVISSANLLRGTTALSLPE
jgi:hypothetical protein